MVSFILNRFTLLLQTGSFIPHGHCYLWQTGLVGLHITADALIALAYYSIPIALFYFVRERKDLPFKWIFLLFGAFIVACGTSHLMAIWTLWHPTYWLSGGIKAITAVISLVTAFELVPLMPLALALPSPIQLEITNHQLQREIAERKQIESALRESEERFQTFMNHSPVAAWITDEHGQILYFNSTYAQMFNVPSNHCIGNTELQIYPPEFRQQYLQNIQQVVATHQAIEVIETAPRCDGTISEFLVYKFPIRESTSTLVGGVALDITERKRIEQALRESEERFRNLIQDLQIGVVVHECDAKIVLSNPKALELLGVDEEQLLGKTSFDPDWNVIHEDGSPFPGALHPAPQAIATHQSVRNVVMGVYRPKLNDRVWLLVDAEPQFRDDGSVRQVVVTFNDITERQAALRERKRAETVLQQREQEFRALVENAPDIIMRLDRECRYLYINPTVEHHTGIPTSVFLGKTIDELGAPDSLVTLWQQIVTRVFETGQEQRIEFESPTRTGVAYYASRVVPEFAENGAVQSVLAIARDITDYVQTLRERQQVEAELRTQRAFLHQVIDVVPNIIFVKDEEGRILVVNQAGATMHGTTVEAMVGKREIDFNSNFTIEQLEQFLETNREVMRTRKPKKILSQLVIDSRGKHHWYQTVINPLINPDGKVIGIVGATTDVSDLKQTEQALQQAKEIAETANQAKSIFLANMSHELRTPLNVILGFTQVMNRDRTLPPEHQETIQIIHRSGEHLLNLINDILDLSKIEAGRTTLDVSNFDVFALLKTLKDMFNQRSTSKGIQFYVEILPDVPQYITADVGKLRQILINLVSNAIKFAEQGRVILRVRLDEHEPNSTGKVWLYFEVEDTGIGIAAHEIDTIFDAFAQSLSGKMTPGGTGLGLTISRRFVRLMGGDISVQSTVGQGSTFVVHIPVRIAQATDIFAPDPQRSIIGIVPGQPSYRILIVDDQAENRLLLVRLMSRLGVEVREAKTGRDAVLVCKQWKPHLIWMDILMPEMDGYIATQAIRSALKGESTVIIALTAHASMSDRDLALAAGCNDFVTKPFNENVLYEKMTEHLGLQFLYAESAPLSSPLPLAPDTINPLTTESLAVMPHAWLVALHRAAQLCDEELIQELIQQMPETAIALAHQLNRLAHDYQFEHIKQLTQTYYMN